MEPVPESVLLHLQVIGRLQGQPDSLRRAEVPDSRNAVSALMARRPRTISLIRRGGTLMSFANRYWLMARGDRTPPVRSRPDGPAPVCGVPWDNSHSGTKRNADPLPRVGLQQQLRDSRIAQGLFHQGHRLVQAAVQGAQVHVALDAQGATADPLNGIPPPGPRPAPSIAPAAA